MLKNVYPPQAIYQHLHYIGMATEIEKKDLQERLLLMGTPVNVKFTLIYIIILMEEQKLKKK